MTVEAVAAALEWRGADSLVQSGTPVTLVLGGTAPLAPRGELPPPACIKDDRGFFHLVLSSQAFRQQSYDLLTVHALNC